MTEFIKTQAALLALYGTPGEAAQRKFMHRLIPTYRAFLERSRSVIVITIAEVCPQCARAFLRSAFWTGSDQSAGLPSIGDMLTEGSSGTFYGAGYDAEWPGQAAKTMW